VVVVAWRAIARSHHPDFASPHGGATTTSELAHAPVIPIIPHAVDVIATDGIVFFELYHFALNRSDVLLSQQRLAWAQWLRGKLDAVGKQLIEVYLIG